jgi:hypothetical protein
MATTDKSYTLSSTSKGPYDFAFPYLNTKDVQVTLNGTRLIPIEEDSANYKFTRQTTQITLVDTPSVGDKLRIYRATDDTNLSSTFYPGSAIKSGDLNDNFTQNLYTTQENTSDASTALTSVREWDPTLDNGTGDWKTAFAKADDAETIAATADGKANTAKLATDSLVATNSGDATNPVWVLQGDGSNTTQNNKGVAYAVDESIAAVASAAQANTTAGNAVTSAANANTTAGNAVTSATNANTTAANAVASAATANTTAGNAVTTANDAETKADTAIATANTASTTAGNAVTTANNAETKADDVEGTVQLYVADSTGLKGDGTHPTNDPQGVKYAVRIAEAASASVAASAIYKVVADLSTLATNYPLTGNQPSPPGPDPNNLAPTPDGTYVQITDSTGISLANNVWTSTNSGATFSGTSGFPSGFDGHSQLTLRVKVSNSTAGSESYVAQEYYANDPESRYGEDRKIIVEHDQVIDANYTIQLDKNAHSVGPVTIAHNGTDLLYNLENHAQPYVATNAATAGNTVTIPVNSTWLIS